jgi:P-type E1-E2 ATPase
MNDGADGASQIYVTRSGQVLGAMRIADVLRPEAKHAVGAMRRMGLKVFLLSGDSQAVATRVGIDLGVDDAIGELLPQDKATWVRRLRHKCCDAW